VVETATCRQWRNDFQSQEVTISISNLNEISKSNGRRWTEMYKNANGKITTTNVKLQSEMNKNILLVSEMYLQ
jgi:hypothetical protein